MFFTTEPELPMSQVKLTTNFGDITIELNETKAPLTCKSFLEYVNNGFYTDTLFHRVIKNFMIQGGGMDRSFAQKKTNDCIPNEANNGLANMRGTVAMARTQDPHSASSQFFINTADNAFLNFKSEDINGWGYCVFAKL